MTELSTIFSTAIPLQLWAVATMCGLAFVFGQVVGCVALWNALAKSGWISNAN